jgi:beta-glucuronidase
MLLLVLALPQFVPGAPRYWPKYSGNREVHLLDGSWSYGFIDGWNSGFDSLSPAFKPSAASTPNKTTVPSCFDTVAGGASGYLGSRGVAMYRRSFVSPVSGASVRLQFQSCSFFCRIWVNGREVGSHLAGGYVAFWLDVPAEVLTASDSPNELFVLADNRFNATTAPMHTGGDFWHYGGITRSVELHTLSAHGPVLWRAYVLPADSSVVDDRVTVGAPKAVDITLVLSDSTFSGLVALTIRFDDGASVAMNATAEDGTAILGRIAVPNARPWSPDAPNLHTVTISLAGGSVTERFGLRRFGVEAKSSRLTINGKVTKLVGWGHHTQWPVTAASPTDAQIDADIALLKKGNANLVRGAHYPHDPRMLDRLDEAGLLFWSETLGCVTHTPGTHPSCPRVSF